MREVALGIDLGGTKTLVGVANEPSLSAPTALSFEASYQTLIELCREALAGRTCAGIGVAIGGPIDHFHRTVSPLHQPEWRNVPLWDLLAQEFGVEPAIEVDTDAAAIAEATERSVGDLYYITWSTGVGGGYFREGALHRSKAEGGSPHPEFGHQIVAGGGEGTVQGCGRARCLESVIGGRAIQERYGQPAFELPDHEWSSLDQIMAVGIVNVWTITGCPLFVLGGSIGIARWAYVQEEVARLQADCSLSRSPNLEPSTYGATASFEGALRLAQANFNTPSA